jgi:hypothetical protein
MAGQKRAYLFVAGLVTVPALDRCLAFCQSGMEGSERVQMRDVGAPGTRNLSFGAKTGLHEHAKGVLWLGNWHKRGSAAHLRSSPGACRLARGLW